MVNIVVKRSRTRRCDRRIFRQGERKMIKSRGYWRRDDGENECFSARIKYVFVVSPMFFRVFYFISSRSDHYSPCRFYNNYYYYYCYQCIMIFPRIVYKRRRRAIGRISRRSDLSSIRVFVVALAAGSSSPTPARAPRIQVRLVQITDGVSLPVGTPRRLHNC